MGLGKPTRSEDFFDFAPRRTPIAPHPWREREMDERRWPVPPFERVAMPKLRCADIEPRHLSHIELETDHCRYPYGGDEEGETITFCGHPRRGDSSYCAAHFDLTRGRGTPAERAAISVALRLVQAA
jgi:GcrA cell cycle regulator